MNTLWVKTGGSVIGGSHIRKGMPNQDAIGTKDLGGNLQVLALSDGHGGAKHLYSDVGSKCAVEAAIETVETYFHKSNADVGIEKIRFIFECDLSKAIQKLWLEKISRHPDYEAPYQYGCTLLLAVKTRDVLVFLQLGDGKIAVVYEDGVVYYPIPKECRYENNETTSLAQPDAWAEMKVVCMGLDEKIHLVGLVSDGVENAYPLDYYDDAYFFLNLARQTELDTVIDDLLFEASQYSKDDSSAVLWRNPDTKLNLRKPEDDLVVWMGEYPESWVPLSSLISSECNKRLDYAILLMAALSKKDFSVSRYLTLKQIYYNSEAERVEILGVTDEAPLDDETCHALISELIGLEFENKGKTKIKQQLIALKRNLRFDYEQRMFFFKEALDRPKGATSDVTSDFSAVGFTAGNGNYEIFYNSMLYLHQLMPLVGDFDALFGKVVQHEKHKEIWGIVNKTDQTWTIIGGTQKQIEPGKTMTIREGITAFIFGLPVKFNIRTQ